MSMRRNYFVLNMYYFLVCAFWPGLNQWCYTITELYSTVIKGGALASYKPGLSTIFYIKKCLNQGNEFIEKPPLLGVTMACIENQLILFIKNGSLCNQTYGGETKSRQNKDPVLITGMVTSFVLLQNYSSLQTKKKLNLTFSFPYVRLPQTNVIKLNADYLITQIKVYVVCITFTVLGFTIYKSKHG